MAAVVDLWLNTLRQMYIAMYSSTFGLYMAC
jgi:hypothetical protein